MEKYQRQLRIAEYSTLRSELLQGKQFVFERPLVIIVAAGVAAAQLAGSEMLISLPASLAALLVLNLAFTVDRLRSMYRISAYIDAVLESGSDLEWIGWERSLREYRTWISQHSQEELRKARDAVLDPATIPDANMFYHHLLAIHVAAIAAAIAGSIFLTVESSAPLAMRSLALGATVVLGLLLGAFAMRQSFGPRKIRAVIEEQRATWVLVSRRTHTPIPDQQR